MNFPKILKKNLKLLFTSKKFKIICIICSLILLLDLIVHIVSKTNFSTIKSLSILSIVLILFLCNIIADNKRKILEDRKFYQIILEDEHFWCELSIIFVVIILNKIITNIILFCIAIIVFLVFAIKYNYPNRLAKFFEKKFANK